MVWFEPLAAATAVVLVDQMSKRYVLARPGLRDAPARRPLIAIQCILNRRAAVLRLHAPWLLVSLWISCVVLALLSLTQRPLAESSAAAIGIGMAVGGITGNLADRLQHGAIVDFIAIGPWPIFNLADAAIVCGFCLVLLAMASIV